MISGRFLIAMAAAGGLIAGQPLAAQVVRGTLTQRDTRAPVPGAVITLRDQSSRPISTVLSDEDGRYEIRAPGPGGYSLEIKRIGVRRSPAIQLTLAEGEAQLHDLVVEGVTPVLTAVKVTGTTSCISRPGDDVATAELWEDARAALTATVVTRRAGGQPGTVSRYVRKLDPRTLRVLEERRNERYGGVDRAFRAIPADDLSRKGYARVGADGVTDYFAPDAEVLLSEVFLVDHCFGVQRRDSSGIVFVGLTFQPVRGRKLPDVRGVLWLDARTAELRTLEYTYTELPGPRSKVSFGGEVGFMRLPSGAWVVRRWYIRMPTYQMVRRNPDPGMPGSMPRDFLELVSVQEEGGEVQLPGGARRSVVRGTIHDSTTGLALTGARVVVRGTSYAADADATGRFTVTDIADGRYSLEVRHPRLDSLGMPVTSEEIQLAGGNERAVSLAVPSMATVRARLCPLTPDSIVQTAGVLRLLVRDASTLVPVSRARVRVTWTEYRTLTSRGAVGLEDGQEVEADTTGALTVCAIPPATLVRLRPAENARQTWQDSVRVKGGGVEVHTLRVRGSAPSLP